MLGLLPAELHLELLVDFGHDKDQACLKTKLRRKEVEQKTRDQYLIKLFEVDSATPDPFS